MKDSRYFLRVFIQLLFLLIPLLTYSQKDSKKCIKLPNNLKEVSGLYLAALDSMWWHNDGGHEPALIQTDRNGNLVKKIDLSSIRNIDWEDITSDNKGHIYIGDFGNNLNRRKDLKIYIYHPEKNTLDSIAFHYPDQTAFPPLKKDWNFNMEGFFWFQDSLHLFSKNNMSEGNHFTKHYKLSANPGTYVAELVDSTFLKKRVVTGAAISPDGQTVALIAYRYKKILGFIPWSAASIFVIRNFSGTNFLKGKIYKKKAPGFILATQMESIDFLDNKTVYVASEKTKFIRQKAKRIKLKSKYFKNRFEETQ